MQSIYTKYLDQNNKANKEYDEMHTHVLALEQEFHISNNEKQQAISLLQKLTVKIKQCKKMINILQSLFFTKLDKILPSIKKLIGQHGSIFTYILSLLVNRQTANKSYLSIWNTYTGSDTGSFVSGKHIKALPDPPIFIDGKDPSID